MPNSILIKTALKGAIAESLINEVSNKTNRLFYFLGRTSPWDLEYSPHIANDSQKNEIETRNNIVYYKQLTANDVSLVVARIDWTFNTTYDIYDDEYSTELVGINLTAGGSGYTSAPEVIITGNGAGAKGIAEISLTTGRVTKVSATTRGSGYVSSILTPTLISFTGGGGIGASAKAVLVAPMLGKSLEDSKFYVLTDDNNVYVCLDNNSRVQSTEKPYGTSSTTLTLPDGYVWKYLYTIPLALRTRFLTPTNMPITNSLKAQFFSAGALRNIKIDANGSGYSQFTKISVTGDGFLESDPVYVLLATPVAPGNGGAGYTTATASFDPPVGGPVTGTAWLANRIYIQGQYISYLGNIYQVSVAGISNTVPPTHTSGIVLNGASYKYIGTVAQANLTVTAGVITAITMLQGIRGVDLSNGGSGYANGPNTMTFSSGTATGVSYAQNGVIYRVDITNKALNTYTTLPTVTSYGGGGTGAAGIVLGQSGAGYSKAPIITISGTGTITTPANINATAVVSNALLYPIISGGSIVGVQVGNGGVGYSSATIAVTGVGTGAQLSADLLYGDITSLQSNTELTAIDGAVYNIPIVSGGYGYTSNPTVIIRGDGVGATATATVKLGVVSKVTVTNPGSDYKVVGIDFIEGGGVGASARAILPPKGGHSKNVIRALNCRTLMIQSDITRDRVNGINLNIGYRQFGIIRNPSVYGSELLLTNQFAASCWTLTAPSIPTSFIVNSIVTSVPISGAVISAVATVTSGIVFSLVSTNGLAIGMSMFAVGVIPGTTITNITGNTITVSQAIAGLVSGTSIRFNYLAKYKLLYINKTTALVHALENKSPSVGDVLNSGGNTFTVATFSPPSVDKYSGDLLYQDNQVPFQPIETSSERITISTVLKF